MISQHGSEKKRSVTQEMNKRLQLYEVSSSNSDTQQWLNEISQVSYSSLPDVMINQCISLIQVRIQWLLHHIKLRNLPQNKMKQISSCMKTFISSITLNPMKMTNENNNVQKNQVEDIQFWFCQLVKQRLSSEIIQRLLTWKTTLSVSNHLNTTTCLSSTTKKPQQEKIILSKRPPLPKGLICGPEFIKYKREFTHGNYNMYYKLRSDAFSKSQVSNPIEISSVKNQIHIDPRLNALSNKYQNELFTNKRILDVGCNIGLITFTLAGLLNALDVTGVDIDVNLVSRALATLRIMKYHYFFKHQLKTNDISNCSSNLIDSSSTTTLPLSYFSSCLPPIPKTLNEMSINLQHLSKYFESEGTSSSSSSSSKLFQNIPFPFNINFQAEEFSLFDKTSLNQLSSASSSHDCSKSLKFNEYDTILLLSVAKWIHLNTGDDGIKRTFSKIYELLRPGGYFILEPQSWESYRKKRRLKNDFKSTLQRIQKSTVKNVLNLNERLKATKPLRKKTTNNTTLREVLQLCGGTGLTSLPIQTHTSEGFKNRSRIAGGERDITKWVWCQFENPAHPAGFNRIHLHHWHPLADATLLPKEPKQNNNQVPTTPTTKHHEIKNPCCNYTAASEYLPAAFNKKAQVVRYSSSFYSKYVAPISSGWTLWETNYLFDLCEEYDLRFPIIYDRYNPVELLKAALIKGKDSIAVQQTHIGHPHGHHTKVRKRSDSVLGSYSATIGLSSMSSDEIKTLIQQLEAHHPRSLEQLKDRYYSIARILVDQEFKKKINSLENRFTEMSQTMENVDALTHQKTQLLAETREELNRHPLIKFHYDPTIDKHRRQYLDRQYRISEKERKNEKELIQQISRSEAASKKAARDELAGTKKKKSVGSTSTTAPPEDQLHELSLEAVQQHLSYHRRPGAVLASQVMSQFASPLLLAAPSSVGTSGNGQVGATAGSIATGSGPGSSGRHGHHHGHHHHPHALQVSKKHEQRIESELKSLGFGASGLPLWPNVNDREIVQAFNALRIDVATLVQCNAKVEQLEKERALWKTKVTQIKEDPSVSLHSPASQELTRKDASGGLDYTSTHTTTSISKKRHIRQSSGTVTERALKKPRKSSKKSGVQQK